MSSDNSTKVPIGAYSDSNVDYKSTEVEGIASLNYESSAKPFTSSSTSSVNNPPTSSSKFSGDNSPASTSGWAGFVDSFKRADMVQETRNNHNLTELEKANLATAKAPLQRSLKNRHIQFISLGGSIGTGLLIASGSSLRTGGASSLIIAWSLVASMVFVIMDALCEMNTELPISGINLSCRFVSMSWGFAVGYNYAIMWLIVTSLELVAAAMTIQYWNTEINAVAWVLIFYVFIMGINLFGVRGYGEVEFVLALIKVVGISGFIIFGIVVVCGGGPTHEFIGGRNWAHPSAFPNGFKGVCTVFVTASYSLAGTELIGLAAANETDNPRKTLPKAIKQVFFRIIFFYLVSLMFVGLLVPVDSPDLLGGASYSSASPFVISIKNSGVKVLPSIFNAVILISVISVANTSVYGASRTVQSLATQGFAPQILAYVDRRGRPLGGILTAAVFGLLCFLSAYKNEAEIFAWLLSVSGLATVFMYFNIALCHVKFRLALTAQGRSADDLAFKSRVGIWGSLYSMAFLVLVLGVQFWVALFPIGSSKPNAKNFFQNYLSGIVIVVFYVGHRAYSRERPNYVKSKDVDLDTGRRQYDLELIRLEMEEEKAKRQNMLFYKKVADFWC